MAALTAGNRAPEFSLEGVDGRPLVLKHPGEEPSVLVFFKNSCPTCQLALPFLERLYQRLDGAGLNFWGLSQDDPEATRTFAGQYSLTFPLAPDSAGYPVSNAYGLTAVPTLFLVEPEGTIAWTSVGFARADLEALAARLHRRYRIPGVTPLFVEADDAPLMKPG